MSGFKIGDQWHLAISVIILMNEPDFYENDPLCTDQGRRRVSKALVLSASNLRSLLDVLCQVLGAASGL